MKRKTLSIILSLACAFVALVGAGATRSAVSASAETATVADSTETEFVDYAGQATLHFNSDSQTVEVTVKAFIDGDTTHFNLDGWGTDNIFKARYAAVNTPESTGTIEPWGKKAATYTKTALQSATSIVLESDKSDWESDSTGTRYMTWVWYKAPNSDVYRNLNLELLQQGLAVGSKAGDSRYGELATLAIAQASALKMHVHSTEKDPDFFYGQSIELDLKELRLNIEYYDRKRVAFEGVVSYFYNNGVYVENYDPETDMYYGIYVYYGFNFGGTSILKIGNKVRISAVVTYYDSGQSYQVSSLNYNEFKPGADDIRLIEKGHAPANVETSAADFTKKIEVEKTDPETGDTSTKSYKYTDLAMNTSVSMKGLYVQSAYTTANGGDNDGAMTLTCKLDGKTINVRTIVLRDQAGNMITQDQLVNKTIDVTGIIDTFNGEAQIKILHLAGIKIDGQMLVGKVPEKPDDSSSSSSSESTSSSESSSSSESESSTMDFTTLLNGCSGVVAASAALPVLVAAFVLIKKREN